MKKTIRRIGFDIAGYGLIIAAPFVGLVPGPGGIPVFAAGLGLLAVHNTWARRLLIQVKKHTGSLREVLFPNNKSVELIWDIVAIAIFILAFAINRRVDHLAAIPISISVGFISTTVFFMNRQRLTRILRLRK